MKSIYETVASFEGSPSEFLQLIRDLKLNEIFDYLPHNYAEKIKAIKYIVYAYSANSKLVTAGDSWKICKQRAAEKAELDEMMRNELVEFQYTYVSKPAKKKKGEEEEKEDDQLVADGGNLGKIIVCINKYLDFQHDRINKHLRRMYDHYEQASSAAVSMPMKNGSVDWDTKGKCQDIANKLLGEIEIWEHKLESKNLDLKDGTTEIRDKKEKVIKSIRMEMRD